MLQIINFQKIESISRRRLIIMAKVNITNILLSDQPEPFLKDIYLEIFIDTLAPVRYPIEWKVIYVGCAEDSQHD